MRGLFESMKVKYKINSRMCKRAYGYLADAANPTVQPLGVCFKVLVLNLARLTKIVRTGSRRVMRTGIISGGRVSVSNRYRNFLSEYLVYNMTRDGPVAFCPRELAEHPSTPGLDRRKVSRLDRVDWVVGVDLSRPS